MVEYLGIPLRTILIAAIAPAFWAITACMVVYLIQRIMAAGPAEGAKETALGIYEGFVAGARQSLSVTVTAALVGVVIGIVTLTGVGFKIAFMVTSVAQDWAGSTHAFLSFLPFELFTMPTLALLFTLILTAVVCVLMGCGVPTTANYIIMVAVAAPVLGMMGVEPLVARFFVFYFGVLADVTPPVALAAYAAAGIAGANGFKAGNTAFRLSMGKALVPFVFAFSPSLLLVERIVLSIAALLMIAPEIVSTLIGAAILGAVFLRQTLTGRSGPALAT
ncbi:TRAP transporter large permease subunit [Pseudogemmobacter blasticus]|uniref:TRAP transporter large permease subunit n=1 Tax=Fuscovulum blasticum TaxID=1075 RepID=UPI0026AC291C